MVKEILLRHSQMSVFRDNPVTGEYDIEFYHEDDPFIVIAVFKSRHGRGPGLRWQTNYGGSVASAKMFAEVLADAIAFAEAQS